MAPPYPAILLGGPPHAGKSTLIYRLSAALSRIGVVHYVMRASPDGEGNWTAEGTTGVVRILRERAKQPWSGTFTSAVARDVARRHLPLLIDAGGKPSPEISQVMARCTHVLLLAANLQALPLWRDMVASHGLPLIAELHSVLSGPQVVKDAGPVLRGVISGLSPLDSSDGPCFDALVQRLAQICTYDGETLFRSHRAMLHDIDLVLHVERPIHPLPAHDPYVRRWQVGELPTLLANLPTDEPLAIYGRGPAWLIAALAALSPQQPFAIFDVRLGWVRPPDLAFGNRPTADLIDWRIITPAPGIYQIGLRVSGGYFDYADVPDITLPIIPSDAGVIIDGKLPNWIFAAIIRRYVDCAWVALREPRSDGAVIVASRLAGYVIGTHVPCIQEPFDHDSVAVN
ncbi:MAG: CRISPR-associated protein Csx3 [Chloroflexales bacterium]